MTYRSRSPCASLANWHPLRYPLHMSNDIMNQLEEMEGAAGGDSPVCTFHHLGVSTDGLKAKWIRFVEAYVATGSGKKAAIEADMGAGAPDQAAYRLRQHTLVSRKIAELRAAYLDALAVSRDSILREMALIATSDVTAYFRRLDGEGAELADLHELTGDQRRAIAEVKVTETGTGKGRRRTVHLKLHDKLKALDQLARALHLYQDGADKQQAALLIGAPEEALRGASNRDASEMLDVTESSRHRRRLSPPNENTEPDPNTKEGGGA